MAPSPRGSDALRVPDTLEEAVSPEWLTAAIGRRYPGVKVSQATLGPVVSRVSTNARFSIECEGDMPAGLSPHLCVKGYFSEVGIVSRRAGEPEAHFYRECAESTGVRTLRCIYADVDPLTRHGVVLTEDVAASGAVFLDALSPYSPQQATGSLEQYAILHGRSWDEPALDGPPWLASRVAATLRARGLPEIRHNFEGPIGAGIPDAVRDPERLIAATIKVADIAASSEPPCLIHGDAHIGNVYLDGRGRPSLLDWQLVQRGPWYLDVGYHIGSALDIEDRRRGENALLAGYLDRLGEEGGEPPPLEDARQALCAGLAYGFFLWAITLKVRPEITTEMLRRLGTAVADHDALTVVLEKMAGRQQASRPSAMPKSSE